MKNEDEEGRVRCKSTVKNEMKRRLCVARVGGVEDEDNEVDLREEDFAAGRRCAHTTLINRRSRRRSSTR